MQKQLHQHWKDIEMRAEEALMDKEVTLLFVSHRIMKDQKKIARQLMFWQDIAFWRVRRPPVSGHINTRK